MCTRVKVTLQVTSPSGEWIRGQAHDEAHQVVGQAHPPRHLRKNFGRLAHCGRKLGVSPWGPPRPGYRHQANRREGPLRPKHTLLEKLVVELLAACLHPVEQGLANGGGACVSEKERERERVRGPHLDREKVASQDRIVYCGFSEVPVVHGRGVCTRFHQNSDDARVTRPCRSADERSLEDVPRVDV